MNYSIEPLRPEHRKAVIDIFNYYTQNSFAAFPDKPMPYDFFDRLIEPDDEYPSVVVKDETGAVAGFAFLHSFYQEDTMRRTAEINYFLMPHITRRGIGAEILKRFTERAREMGIDNIIACVSSLNGESIAFHIKYGFMECGRIHAAGRKFGRDFDIVWMQKRI